MGRKQLDVDAQAQAILYAAVHGDEAAQRRFKVSLRSLQRYRELARDSESELARTVAAYAAALDPDRRSDNFAEWMTAQVRAASSLLMEKAGKADPRNPDALRAINEHVGVLLDHKAALDYIDRLFGPGEQEGDAE